MAAVARLAKSMQVSLDELAFCALNRLMLQPQDPELGAEARRLKEERRTTLPTWSDTAHSVHVYESKPDEAQHPRHRPTS